MAIYKDTSTTTWRVVYRYTDWRGERKQTQKRGFATKREAVAWEREQSICSAAGMNMTFKSFISFYEADMKMRIKESTWHTKAHIIRTKLLPYFGKRKMQDILPRDVIAWQNDLLRYRNEQGHPYSQVYLKTLHNQLSAVFNHAVKYYGLQKNPAVQAGGMGQAKGKEMLFWTKEEYLQFAEAMMDKPMSFYAFELLYWCGIREGELLALTAKDFDFAAGTVSITKTYHRFQGQEQVTSPKTPKSNRVIKMPEFLCREMQEYLQMLYEPAENERIFPCTRRYLQHEMARGCKETGVKKIRVHDLRHSHVSLLIDMGFTALAIADRIGHESINVTYQYAHLFPSRQTEIAQKLDVERKGEFDHV